jgi:hypothetical protein
MKLQKFLSLFPAIVLFVVMAGTSASFAVAPEDFVNPPSNFEPMNIYIKDFNYMGYMPLKGDKIGVFNEKASGDTLCVGFIQMAKNLSEFNPGEYIRIIAYKEYKENGIVLDAGFTENDTIKFYLLVKETNQVVAIPHAIVTYLNTTTGVPLPNPVLFYGRGTVVVSIKSIERKLSIAVNPVGTGETKPKSDDYTFMNQDTVVTIQINTAATKQHYRFSHWTVDGVDDASSQLQLQMNEDHNVTAQFVKKLYILTAVSLPADAGDLIPKNPTQYEAESLVSIEAKPTDGSPYVFSRWVVSPDTTSIVDPEQASTDITMTSDVQVTAVFVKKKVTLSLQGHAVMGDVYIKMEGDADSSKAAAEYELTHGSLVTLYAVSTEPDKYSFTNWSGDIEKPENPVTVSVDSNMTVVANFEDTTPVELASFAVQYAPNSVSHALLLKWQTASETNNLGFDVERSIGNDSNWKKIGFLEGYGTTTEIKYYEFIDEDATTEGTYFYRLKQNDTNGAFEYSNVVQFSVSAPSEYALAQNYPNPFNPSTQIVFQIKEDIQVSLTVYDLLGRQVATVVDQQMKAGTHKVTFDATDLSAGLYFYSLKAGSFHEMKKMTLIK